MVSEIVDPMYFKQVQRANAASTHGMIYYIFGMALNLPAMNWKLWF
jgi:hypothetical protein